MAASQKKFKVGKTEYTLQKVSPREWSRLKARCRDRQGNFSEEKFYDEVLEYIVVQPKVTLDDFEDVDVVEEVITEAVNFQSGKQVL